MKKKLKRIIKIILKFVNKPYISHTIRSLLKNLYSYAPWNIKEYLEKIHFYSLFISKGDLCFDIGANYGKYTRIFSRLGAKVISIEPQRACVKKLYIDFRGNKNIIIVGKAIGETEKITEITICEQSSSLSTLSNKWRTQGPYASLFNKTKTQKVEMIILNKLIEIYGVPKFCKIDVEGYEPLVLSTLKVKIPFLSLEFHSKFLDDLVKCLNLLSSIGKIKLNYILSDGLNFKFPQWMSQNQLSTALKSSKIENLYGEVFVRYV